MSTIDAYPHQRVGIVRCPSRFAIVHGNDRTRFLPIYRLDVDVTGETDIDGRRGDILVGGGHGESAALRIAIPEAFLFYTHPGWDAFQSMDDIHHAYWTMTEAYVFGDGYERLGWTPSSRIEGWLTEHVLSFLAHTYPDQYGRLLGDTSLGQNGSICGLDLE
jgi:hypothetical protein